MFTEGVVVRLRIFWISALDSKENKMFVLEQGKYSEQKKNVLVQTGH
jgi:hypothetical protein